MLLTEKVIARLKPADKRLTILDDSQRHFGVRVEVNGRRSYFFYANVDGPKYKSLGEVGSVTLKDARARAAEFDVKAAEWKKNGYPPEENPFIDKKPPKRTAAPTFQSLVIRYTEEHIVPNAKNPRRSAYDIHLWMRGHLKDWQDCPLDTLSRDDVLELKRKVTAPIAFNRLKQFLSRVVRWSAKNYYKLPNDILENIGVYRETKRTRYLNPAELLRFVTALAGEKNTDLKHILTLAMSTGARRGDLFSMKWADIDEVRQIWRVPDPKSRQSYEISLLPKAVEALEERRRTRTNSPFVFPSDAESGHVETISRAWGRFRKRAQIENFRLHDTRHNLASHMIQSGESLSTIAAALGHRDISSTARYAHVSPIQVHQGRLAGERLQQQLIRQARRLLPAKT
jgi:integrase